MIFGQLMKMSSITALTVTSVVQHPLMFLDIGGAGQVKTQELDVGK